jgi:thiamine pyrophosphate-dependent acetolactate synthase large subunit-like protein
MHVFEAVGHLIVNAGLDTVFGLPGSSNMAWLGAGLEAGQFTYIGVRQEGAAITAAGAYAKATGRVGVATTTQGPGFASAVNSVAALAHDHLPVLYIVGHSPNAKGGGDFQQLNQREICAALGVGYFLVNNPRELEDTFWQAMEAVTWNSSFQVLAIDEGILAEETTLAGITAPPRRDADNPDPDSVATIIDLLAGAKRPLIIAGRGVAASGARVEVEEMAELTGARLGTTLAIHGFFAGHPRDIGVIGRSSSPAVAEAVLDSDVVLTVGASLSHYTTLSGAMFPQARIIQIEINADQEFRASAPGLGLLADAKVAMQALLEDWHTRGLAPKAPVGHLPTVAEVRASMHQHTDGYDPARGLDPRDIYTHLDDTLPPDRVVVTDGGRSAMTLPALLRTNDEHHYVPSRGYGSIGLGIGAAIGAAVALPHNRVVLCCGDGGFSMSTQELETIRRYGLNVLIVVLNDLRYGSEVKYLRRAGLPPTYAALEPPNFELLAQAYGGTGIVVTTLDELRAVDLMAPGLVILDARIDPLCVASPNGG